MRGEVGSAHALTAPAQPQLAQASSWESRAVLGDISSV